MDIAVKPVSYAPIADLVEIANIQLGESYLDHDSFIGSDTFGFYAEADGRRAGFCIGRIYTLGAFITRYPALEPYLTRFQADTIMGYVSSIAVAPEFENMGIGYRLMTQCSQELVRRGARVLSLTAWRAADVIHIESLAMRLNFEKQTEIPMFWHDDSIKEKYECPQCGKPPCMCSAIFYLMDDPVALDWNDDDLQFLELLISGQLDPVV